MGKTIDAFLINPHSCFYLTGIHQNPLTRTLQPNFPLPNPASERIRRKSLFSQETLNFGRKRSTMTIGSIWILRDFKPPFWPILSRTNGSPPHSLGTTMYKANPPLRERETDCHNKFPI